MGIVKKEISEPKVVNFYTCDLCRKELGPMYPEQIDNNPEKYHKGKTFLKFIEDDNSMCNAMGDCLVLCKECTAHIQNYIRLGINR